MIEKLLEPEIRDLIETGDLETLGEVLDDWLPADLAGLIADMEEPERIVLLRALRQELLPETFSHLDRHLQEELLAELTQQELSRILNVMSPDDRTALLESLPEEVTTRLIGLLLPAERAVALALLGYPEDSVGRLMTPDYIAVHRNWKIQRVLDYVRTYGKDSETLNVIYVIDDGHRLIDDLRIGEFLLAPLESTVESIMDNQFIALNVNDDQEGAVEMFRKYDRTVLPVVDPRGQLLGIVTIDDVLDIAEEEATEDIQKFGGLEALDLPYMATPLIAMVRKRATWLVVLFLGEMLTATAMAYFEGAIAKAVVLSLFIPLILSSGGNSGSQAATLIIRALTLGEVRLRDWWLVMRREIFSGLMLGVILGTIGFLRIAVWSLISPIYGPHWLLIGTTVAISLVGAVLWGTLAGSMLPLILKRLGADPATSSAPFVATLVDVTGLIIYFTVAVLILRGTLL